MQAHNNVPSVYEVAFTQAMDQDPALRKAHLAEAIEMYWDTVRASTLSRMDATGIGPLSNMEECDE